jgi:hypothetical protein
MKIAHLLSGLSIVLSNEERKFLEEHDEVKITGLTEHDQWLAQNLVRKGVYTISKDNNTLVKNTQ